MGVAGYVRHAFAVLRPTDDGKRSFEGVKGSRRRCLAKHRKRSESDRKASLMPKTLYLCYFGVLEPLVQTQVLPYLREIRKGGTEVSILTFEPESLADP